MLAWFSPDIYRDVAFRRRGYGAGYLALLVAVASIPAAVRAQRMVMAFIRETAPALIRQIPTMTFSNGTLSIDRPTPYIIMLGTATWAVFDPDGVYDGPRPQGVLVRRDRMLVRQPDGKTQPVLFTGVDGITVDQRFVASWMAAVARWFLPVSFVVFAGTLFLARLLQALLFSLAANALARSFGRVWDAPTLVRLSVLALTPMTLAGGALNLLDLFPAGWWLASFIVTAGYLYFAVDVTSRPAQTGGFSPDPGQDNDIT